MMISRAALIRAANLDNLEPRMMRAGIWSWDDNKYDVWVSANGRSVTVSAKSALRAA